MALAHTAASFGPNLDPHHSSLAYRHNSTNASDGSSAHRTLYEPYRLSRSTPRNPPEHPQATHSSPPISTRLRRRQPPKQLAMLPHIQQYRQALQIQSPAYPHPNAPGLSYPKSGAAVPGPGSLLQLQEDKVIHNPQIVRFANEELVRSVEWNATTSPGGSPVSFPDMFRRESKSDSRVCLSAPGSQLRNLQADVGEESTFHRDEEVNVRRFDSLTEKWIPMGSGRVIDVAWTRCWTGTKGYEYVVALKASGYLHSERFSPYLGEIYRGTMPPPALPSVNYVYVIIHKPLPTGFADPSGNQYCLAVISPAVALSRVNGNQYRVRSLCPQYRHVHFLVNEVFPYTAETVDACKYSRFHVLKANGELDRTSYSHQFGLRMKEQGAKPFILPWEQE